MKTETLSIVLIIILLIAGNVWQWHNPKVIEVPGEQEQIDETAWVQRAAYVNRGTLLDSLRKENQALEKRVRESRDEIANLTTITGKLNLKVDSLESNRREIDLSSMFALPAPRLRQAGLPEVDVPDPEKSLAFTRIFGDGLFRVDSQVRFSRSWMENDLEITQLRDIRLSVVNTMNTDQSRLLTYVTSPDFEDLEYQSYSQLKRKKKFPWFWVGLGTGVAGAAIILN